MYVLSVAAVNSLLQIVSVGWLLKHRHHFALRHTQVPLIAASSLCNGLSQLLLGLKLAHLIPCSVMLASLTLCLPLSLLLGLHMRAVALILAHAHHGRLQGQQSRWEEELMAHGEELTVEERGARTQAMSPAWHRWVLLLGGMGATGALSLLATLLLRWHDGHRCTAVWLYAPLLLMATVLILLGLPLLIMLLWRLPTANRLRRELQWAATCLGGLLLVYLLAGSVGQLPRLRLFLPPWLMIMIALQLTHLVTVLPAINRLWPALHTGHATQEAEEPAALTTATGKELYTVHECLQREAQCQQFFHWLEETHLAAPDLMLIRAILRYERIASCHRYPQFILANEALLIYDLYLGPDSSYPVNISCRSWLADQLWAGWSEHSFEPIREQIERRLAAWWYPQFLQSLDPLQKASFYH